MKPYNSKKRGEEKKAMVALLVFFFTPSGDFRAAKGTGAPNDGFLLNTLTTRFRPTEHF